MTMSNLSILDNAAAVLLAHTHPSGNATPSGQGTDSATSGGPEPDGHPHAGSHHRGGMYSSVDGCKKGAEPRGLGPTLSMNIICLCQFLAIFVLSNFILGSL
ncbi:JAB domain-containing protein [Xanthomonas sacchari]|uniref:JAB domain-containing protein n=1 Tax=Xanthomonas sacchari TaxID=56458 RepID=UPI003D2F5EBD